MRICITIYAKVALKTIRDNDFWRFVSRDDSISNDLFKKKTLQCRILKLEQSISNDNTFIENYISSHLFNLFRRNIHYSSPPVVVFQFSDSGFWILYYYKQNISLRPQPWPIRWILRLQPAGQVVVGGRAIENKSCTYICVYKYTNTMDLPRDGNKTNSLLSCACFGHRGTCGQVEKGEWGESSWSTPDWRYIILYTYYITSYIRSRTRTQARMYLHVCAAEYQ